MDEVVIRAENLGKRYHIGRSPHEPYPTLRSALVNLAKSPLRAFSNGRAAHTDATIWALKGVSFEVRRGQVVGVIGRNGAGKSTLLKILSRITKPTEGRATIRGRVGSLLEVGTGFHPELTGRENIYMNGAILGMKRAEIARKFDEIVAFAEIEKFLDTPVKFYSSGMYVRLAFAVAAHLEPEILLVDEVLAVGDAAFQKKCLGKMGDVAKEGRTVVFVSHNMSAVLALCQRALLLKNGAVSMDDRAPQVASFYQSEAWEQVSHRSDLNGANRKGNRKARFLSIHVNPLGARGEPVTALYSGCDLEIETQLECLADFSEANVAVIISDVAGYRLIDANTALDGVFVSMKTGDKTSVRFLLQNVLLKPGIYYIGLWIGRGGIEEMDYVEYAAKFEVLLNPENTRHAEVFPGPYVCRFRSTIMTELQDSDRQHNRKLDDGRDAL